MSQVATQQPANVYEIVDAQEQFFKKASVDQQIIWAKECQFATQYLQANQYLNKVAWGNQTILAKRYYKRSKYWHKSKPCAKARLT